MPVGPTIVVQGGERQIIPENLDEIMDMMKTGAAVGYHSMMKGGSALDAVEQTIRRLENSELFDVGASRKGIYTEQEASIMDGATMDSGAGASLEYVKNPIHLARIIMEKYPNIVLAVHYPSEFAQEIFGIPIIPEEERNLPQYQKPTGKKYLNIYGNHERGPFEKIIVGTVGAVACDIYGNVAAGTSSGWITHAPGILWSCMNTYSTYADNTVGAVSVSGELKIPLAYCISHTMQKGTSPINACKINLQYQKKRWKKTAGAIAVSKNGEVGFATTAPIMPLAYITNNLLHYGSRMNRIFTEPDYRISLKSKSCCCPDIPHICYKQQRNSELQEYYE